MLSDSGSGKLNSSNADDCSTKHRQKMSLMVAVDIGLAFVLLRMSREYCVPKDLSQRDLKITQRDKNGIGPRPRHSRRSQFDY